MKPEANKKQWMVYAHINPNNGQVFYIGIGINKRPYDIIRRNPIWHKYVAKYGHPNVSILHSNLEQKEALRIESELVNKYGKKKDGGSLTNIVDGGINPMMDADVKQRWLKVMSSKEHKEKMKALLTPEKREKMRALLNSPEVRLKIKNSLNTPEMKLWRSINNPMKSASAKAKISEIMKGRKFADKTLKKMSESAKKRGAPLWAIAGYRKKLNTGWKPTQKNETREKIKKRLTGLKRTQQTKIRNGIAHSKPVLQYSLDNKFIAKYPSQRAAAKAIGCTGALIGMAISGQVETGFGFKWYRDNGTRGH